MQAIKIVFATAITEAYVFLFHSRAFSRTAKPIHADYYFFIKSRIQFAGKIKRTIFAIPKRGRNGEKSATEATLRRNFYSAAT